MTLASTDGLFVGLTFTGIYCRPLCPARTPRRENCCFFPSAPAAQEAGYRPCLRCRPEAAPEHAAWRGTSNTVARALERIAQGALDGEATVEQLAEGLGVGERHLRRLFQEHLGASPIAVAQTRRVLFAKQLLHETRLPLGEVALAAGFQSVRRFNEVFRALYRRAPGTIRRKAQQSAPSGSAATAGVRLRLQYRSPYDWPSLLEHLRARALAGVEQVSPRRYCRTWREGDAIGSVEVENCPERFCLSVQLRTGQVAVLPRVVRRLRHVFDLDADVLAINAQLAADEWLAPLLAARPGLRVPGGWDGFELGVRALLGQQVSVPAAQLRRVRGIGDWTAHYIALRAAREPDAFPASDRGLLRGAELCAGHSLSTRALEQRALRWRPWRAQAAQQLWAHDAAARAARARLRRGEGSAGAPHG